MREENYRLKHEGEMRYAREEGLKQGIEQKELQLVKNMLNKKYSYDDISELTGKTVDEIRIIENSII